MNLQFSKRGVAVGATIALAVLLTVLVVQGLRHGWPFSAPLAPTTGVDAGSEAPQSAAKSPLRVRADVELRTDQASTLGIKMEPVLLQPFSEPLRAVAVVVADESRISHIHTRASGWIETLYVNTTGQSVKAGQPLAAVFSQELYSSQNEYLTTLRQSQSGPTSAAVAAGRTRLSVLGMSDREISQIEKTGQSRRLVTILAPRDGVVLRRGVTAGTAVDPSTEIATIVDYSRVWVLAEANEADFARIQPGLEAKLTFPSSGRAPFVAVVDFVYPTLTEGTRTGRVRFSAPNTDGRLRPGSYGTAEFNMPPRDVLTVPRDAVVYSGDSHLVYVRAPGDTLRPRAVEIGARLGDRIEVSQGLALGEEVVSAGVFLIDSESRLRASGVTGHSGHSSPPTGVEPKSADPATQAKPQPADSHSSHDKPE